MGNEGKEEMCHSGDHHGSSSEPQATECGEGERLDSGDGDANY